MQKLLKSSIHSFLRQSIVIKFSFLDENDKVYRLLLNAILLKYAALWEKAESRERYLTIAVNSAMANEEDETPCFTRVCKGKRDA